MDCHLICPIVCLKYFKNIWFSENRKRQHIACYDFGEQKYYFCREYRDFYLHMSHTCHTKAKSNLCEAITENLRVLTIPEKHISPVRHHTSMNVDVDCCSNSEFLPYRIMWCKKSLLTCLTSSSPFPVHGFGLLAIFPFLRMHNIVTISIICKCFLAFYLLSNNYLLKCYQKFVWQHFTIRSISYR